MARQSEACVTKRDQQATNSLHSYAVAAAAPQTATPHNHELRTGWPVLPSDARGLRGPLHAGWRRPHLRNASSIQAWLDSGKLTSPTTGATLGIGGTRLVPNYAVKRTIAELAARGRLPPKGTSPRLATEVSQVTAAAEVLTVAEEPLPPPPPSDPRITAQFSEGGHGFSDRNSNREAAGRASLRAAIRGASPRAARASPIATKLCGAARSSAWARSSTRARTRCTSASSRNKATSSATRASPSPRVRDAPGSAGARKKKKGRAARPGADRR